ncbi:MAG: hypothetical protein M0036_24690 [Desulfobacteraceae bacterium]|nr:hypothetical protein [Desulfobacteraceae bacterium]
MPACRAMAKNNMISFNTLPMRLSALICLVLVGTIALVVIGCAQTSLLSGPEPQRIVIRNATGVDLAYVYLGADINASVSGARYATIAPVPKGASQQAARATNAPALPKKVMVKFQPVNAEEIRQVVNVRSALRQGGDNQPLALVFLIRPDYTVELLLE